MTTIAVMEAMKENIAMRCIKRVHSKNSHVKISNVSDHNIDAMARMIAVIIQMK